MLVPGVALLAEGVDRNSFAEVEQVMNLQSPSSRRAWIEILSPPSVPHFGIVALLAEGVDRNLSGVWQSITAAASPSSRRAWIEIYGA